MRARTDASAISGRLRLENALWKGNPPWRGVANKHYLCRLLRANSSYSLLCVQFIFVVFHQQRENIYVRTLDPRME